MKYGWKVLHGAIVSIALNEGFSWTMVWRALLASAWFEAKEAKVYCEWY
jgi:hypothetical protein